MQALGQVARQQIGPLGQTARRYQIGLPAILSLIDESFHLRRHPLLRVGEFGIAARLAQIRASSFQRVMDVRFVIPTLVVAQHLAQPRRRSVRNGCSLGRR